MDFSSLTEAQQEQLRQLQQLFQEHQQAQQAQQQQKEAETQQSQQQQYQNYASQGYDQSYYSCYQDPQQSQHPQQQQNPNCQTDYANAHHQQPHQSQQSKQPPPQQHQHQYQYSHHESAPIHPPETSQSKSIESASTGLGQGQVQVEPQQNAYYPKQGEPGGDQLNPVGSPVVPQGLHPAAAAAVAALAQLTQFVGTMGAEERTMLELQLRQSYAEGEYGPMVGPGPLMGAESMHYGSRPMHPQAGRSPYRGGGRRGGGPYRGGVGNFGNRPPRTGGSGPPFRGRGRGRGRGGPTHNPPHGASSISHPEPSAAEVVESTEEEAGPSADNHIEDAQAEAPHQTSVPPHGNAAPNPRQTRIAWCELCRVDCTSFEVLEQHKNGKKHKKNLQRLEELKLQPENVKEGEEPAEAEAVTDESKMETEQKNDVTKVLEFSGEEQLNEQVNRFDNQRHGMKRKMRGGGRGGKRMKTSDVLRQRPIEPPKPKVVIPLICDLCNVKCDTQEVFDSHLAGKKHISKLKRFEGHQAMYGPMGLQALYPPNPIMQTLFHQQGPQQAFYCPQGPYPPPGAYVSSQSPQQSESETKQVATVQMHAGNGVLGSEVVQTKDGLGE